MYQATGQKIDILIHFVHVFINILTVLDANRSDEASARFASVQVLGPLDFGALGDGRHDDSRAVWRGAGGFFNQIGI